MNQENKGEEYLSLMSLGSYSLHLMEFSVKAQWIKNNFIKIVFFLIVVIEGNIFVEYISKNVLKVFKPFA